MKSINKGVCVAAVAMVSVGFARGGDPLASWTTSSLNTPPGVSALGRITYEGGIFVVPAAVYNASGTWLGAAILSSADGVNWVQRFAPNGFGIGDFAFGNGQFVATAGGPGPTSLTSPDGINWTLHTNGVPDGLASLAYGQGLFVGLGGTYPNQDFVSSPDGIHWTARPSNMTNTPVPGVTRPAYMIDLAYGNGVFVAFSPPNSAYPSGVTAVSRDGINWTQVAGSAYANAIAFGNGQFVIVGGEELAPGHSDAFIVTTTDGINGAVPFDSTNLFSGFTFVAFGGGQFVVGGLPGDFAKRVYTSSDGTNWIERALPTGLSTVTFGNGRFVGIGGGNVLRSGVFVQLGASLSPGGALEGTIAGVPGQVYSVQSSPDLAVWTSLTNVTVNTNGVAQFTDPDTGKASHRFYAAGPPSP